MVFAYVFHAASAVAAAYFLSAFSGDAASGAGKASHRAIAAAAFGLASFLFVPAGSLPPLVDTAWGAAGFFVFFTMGTLVRGAGISLPLYLCAVFIPCAAFFYFRGIPGNALNLGTFSAMPFWSVISLLDGAAFILLAVAGVISLNGFFPRRIVSGDFTGYLPVLAGCALWVTLFFPLNAAPYLSWPDGAVAGADAVLFWIKILAAYGVARFAALIPFHPGILPALIAVAAALLFLSF